MEREKTARLNYCYNCMHQLTEGETVCPVCGHANSKRTNPRNALPEGTILDGKFLVGRVLGQGGFGITYIGFDLTLDVRAAIKEYFPVGVGIRDSNSLHVTSVSQLEDPDGFQKGCDEFQAEAKTLARFNSPNIVHVREYFRENGTAYIVMDYIDGVTLTKEAELCGGKMPWERVVSLFTPLMKELGKLHEEHLVHRDIKPDNLKLVKDRKSGEEHLVLLDFGSARSFVSENVTKTYTAMVTPGYAPIEQYSAKSRQGPYTDVYSLSATMYALITGEVPATATDRLSGIDDIQPIHTKEADIPESVEKAILHGMEGHSFDRPQTMKELYEEITAGADAVLPGKSEEKTVRIQQRDWNRMKRQDDLPERPEAKKTGNRWLIPLLLAVLFAGGFFLYRNLQQNHQNTAVTQTALFLKSEQETRKSETQTAVEAENMRIAQEKETQTAIDSENTRIAQERMTEQSLSVQATGTQEAAYRLQTEVVETQKAISLIQTKSAEPTATGTPAPTSTKSAVPTPANVSRPDGVINPGEFITFGSFEQDSNRNNGTEPVEWLVLAVEGDRALVISKYGLESGKYNESNTNTTWETSSLRKWLNGDFYNDAFSSDEKSRILQVTNENTDNNTYGTAGGSRTSDRVFLLSADEADRYFDADYERTCGVTEYARNKGAFMNNTGGFTRWWLRTPGNDAAHVSYVNDTGITNNKGFRVNSDSVSVRPAFWLNLSQEEGVDTAGETAGFNFLGTWYVSEVCSSGLCFSISNIGLQIDFSFFNDNRVSAVSVDFDGVKTEEDGFWKVVDGSLVVFDETEGTQTYVTMNENGDLVMQDAKEDTTMVLQRNISEVNILGNVLLDAAAEDFYGEWNLSGVLYDGVYLSVDMAELKGSLSISADDLDFFFEDDSAVNLPYKFADGMLTFEADGSIVKIEKQDNGTLLVVMSLDPENEFNLIFDRSES